MFEDKNLTYILTSLEAIEKLKIYSANFTNAHDFWLFSNQINFNASSNLLLVIGEETKKIDKALKELFSHIPWVAISDLRNRLAHDYRGTDPDILWEIISEELDILKDALIKMIGKIDYEAEMLLSALNSPYYKNLHYLTTQL